MRSTQQMSITLPNGMAALIKEKVRLGQYASESEVVRDGLRTLLARDRAVEHWLQGSVAGAYDAMQLDPARALSVAQVRAKMKAVHTKALKTVSTAAA
ncbi:MAG: type II toxin-antitoxin system ParD family antitoxin [Burkholderiaceae bacterium]